MKKIDSIGFVVKSHAPNIDAVVKTLIDYLQQKQLRYIMEEPLAGKINGSSGIPRKKIPSQVDLVIVLGGDGTLLSIAHLAAQENVPVLGVNLGRLGFLTEVPVDEMLLTLDAYLAGNDKIVSARKLLKVESRDQINYCLNDMVINKGALARMVRLAIWVDDKEILIPRCDGLIIATPTGSTAYSLSAGGPIIHPWIPAMIIAPICPHTLSFRPMVISSESRVKLQLLSAGEKAYMTLDGQRGNLMRQNEVVTIKISDKELHLISSPKRNYFDLLQEKLNWG